MSKSPDFTQFFKDSYFDVKSMAQVYARANEYGAKFSKINLEAAEKSLDLANAWIKDSLGKLDVLTKPESEPTELARTLTEVASSQFQAAPEYIAKYTDVARSAQIAAIELFMTAGAEAQSEAVSTAKKAGAKVADAA